MIKPLTQASIKWHEQRDQALVNTSLKACLFSMLLKETAARIELFENNPASMEAAVKASWITLQQPGNEIKWLYQKWDPDTQEMVLDKDRPGCTHAQAKQIINTMDGALTKDPAALNQFKALRQLTTNMQGASVAFQVSVGLRGPTSQTLHEAFKQLEGLAVLQLIAGNMHQSRQRHCKEANIVRQMLGL